MTAFGTPESIGEANKKLILERLKSNGPMSRADLSRNIGLSFTSIASNVKALLDNDYLREVGAGDNSHGRKSTLLSFNARRGYVVGVDVGRTKIRCMLADLSGDKRAEAVRAGRRTGGGEGMIAAICAAVEETVAASGVGDESVLCICAGIPGVVREGGIYLAPNFADFSVEDFHACLKRRYGAEVLVENGVNLGAIGEHRFCTGERFDDMVYISYGVGLGAALILGGKLFAGFNNAAGEIGFMQTRVDSERPRFRETGELEGALAPGGASGRKGARALAELVRGYAAGDAGAVSVLDDVAANFAMALVNICAVVNPRATIVSGGVGRAIGPLFLARWREHLSRHLPFPPELVLSELDEREIMLGAVGTAVDYVDAMPIVALAGGNHKP